MIAAARYQGSGGRTDIAFAAMIVAAVVLTLALALAYLAPPRLQVDLAAADVVADDGFAYAVRLRLQPPPGFRIVGDGGSNAAVSSLQLLENGKLLGAAHAGHVDIRTQGGGLYSHWGTGLWFSASDSTDPRSNGRTYSISVKASVRPMILPAVAMFDLIVLVAAWRWLSINARFRDRLINAVISLALVLAVLVAAGAFDRINSNAGAPKDVALVTATLAHAIFGCVIILMQWMAGAGLARLVLPTGRATLADALILGFALGLPVAAALAVMALAIPYGIFLAVAAWLLCCLPLRGWRPEEGELARLTRTGVAMLPFAIGFGCWLGLLWHGPTATLAGSPSGDLVYYSTSIVSLATQLYPYLNLGYAYEPLNLYFNILFPLTGAALSRALTFDPFLFIAAGGGATFVLACGMMLNLYVRGTGILARDGGFSLPFATLALAFVIANRYPYWSVESIPVIHAVPLTIAVVYWARKSDARERLLAFVLAVAGSALSKVVGAAVLAPFAAAAAVPRFFQMSRRFRIAAILAALAAVIYVAVLIHQNGPTNFTVAPLGPVSLTLALRYHADVWTVLPFAMRDVSAVLLAGCAFLLVDWWLALAIAFGFLLFLAYPFLFQFDFVCAAIILGMVACDHPERLRKYAIATFGGFVLALPAAVLTDPAGISSGLVWLVCVGGAVWLALPMHAPTTRQGWGRVAAFAALVCLGLTGVARGNLVPASGWQAGVLTPQVRQIWLTVKERTPPDALVFTDQTGPEPTLLGAWNTYAFIGARQIFVSNLYMNAATRENPARARETLRQNEAILSGETLPGELRLRGQYSSYYAVVSNARRLPDRWRKIFRNDCCSLYRFNPS
jgi:hypothetical protein